MNRQAHASPGRSLGDLLLQLVLWLSLLVGGMVLGRAVLFPPEAWGQVRDAAPAEMFRSGGQLAVPVLNEIAATLKQIDGRLARLELIAERLQATRTSHLTETQDVK